jgi:hypothetical protein
MGFGGTIEGFRLFIPDTLENCTAADSCPTYESGRLVEGGAFEIHTLEVWGCGGEAVVDAALRARTLQREIEVENINKVLLLLLPPITSTNLF